MEREPAMTWSRIRKTLGKFKYPLLVLLLGAALLLWPSAREQEVVSEQVSAETAEPGMEERMEAILSCIDGAGQVRVLLTWRTDDETVYQTDTAADRGGDGGERTETTTVLASAAGGGEAPLIRQRIYGAYQGALVVCQGADSAAVRLKLVNAVADLTGLSTDRITVIKMKA